MSETDRAQTDALQPLAAVHRTLVRWWWALFAVFLAVFLPLAAWFYFHSAPVRSIGHDFLFALETGNYTAAFNLCSPALQQTLGDETALRRIVESANNFYAPAVWTGVTIGGDLAELRATAEIGGRRYAATLHLQKIGNEWRVSRFSSTAAGHAALQIPPR